MEKEQDKKKTVKVSSILIIVGVCLALFIALTIVFFGVSTLASIGNFISSQVLGMAWLNTVVGNMLIAINVDFAETIFGSALQFFIYDVIKIMILLCILIFAVSYIQSFFPPERTKAILEKHKGIRANILGALLGTVTPFCSCSSIPIFMGFTRAGISSGITFSFLISSPLVDLGAFILLASTFGFPIAIAYVVTGLLLAVIGGTIIEKTGAGKHVEDFINSGTAVNTESATLTKKERVRYGFEQVGATIKKVWPYILIGVWIGAAIHNFVPQEFIQALLGDDKWYSVFLATAVGVPMYADIFGTIPVAEALYAKGVGVGTILSFMMSVTALSVPSLIMLKKAVKKRLMFAFVLVVVIGIIIIGFLFNAISFIFIV